MSRARRVHHATTYMLSVVMVALGVALVARTLAAGGGPLSTGLVLGAAFVAAGAARLYLRARARDG